MAREKVAVPGMQWVAAVALLLWLHGLSATHAAVVRPTTTATATVSRPPTTAARRTDVVRPTTTGCTSSTTRDTITVVRNRIYSNTFSRRMVTVASNHWQGHCIAS